MGNIVGDVSYDSCMATFWRQFFVSEVFVFLATQTETLNKEKDIMSEIYV